MHCFAVNDIARHCGYYADTESLRSTVTALHCTSLEASCLCWGYDILGHLIEVKSGAEYSRSPKSFVRIQGSKMFKRSIDLFKTFQKQLVELWPTVVPVAWSQHMPKLFREKPSFFWEADKRRGNHVWQLHLDCLRIHLIHLPSGKKLESYLHDHILKPLGMCPRPQDNMKIMKCALCAKEWLTQLRCHKKRNLVVMDVCAHGHTFVLLLYQFQSRNWMGI